MQAENKIATPVLGGRLPFPWTPQGSQHWKRKFSRESFIHGLINCIDIKAKCRHLKKFTCKGTFRQAFICLSYLRSQSWVENTITTECTQKSPVYKL